MGRFNSSAPDLESNLQSYGANAGMYIYIYIPARPCTLRAGRLVLLGFIASRAQMGVCLSVSLGSRTHSPTPTGISFLQASPCQKHG